MVRAISRGARRVEVDAHRVWTLLRVFVIYGIGGACFIAYVYCEATWQRVWSSTLSSKS